MKLYVAVSLGQLRRDYLIDAEKGHDKIAADLIRKEKIELTKEEKQLGLRYEPRYFGCWLG